MQARRESAEIFFRRIKKSIPLQTEPALMEKIFTELKLNDLQPRDPSLSQFLRKLRTHPVDITLLIEKTVLATLANEPLCALFSHIQDNELITDAEIEKSKNAIKIFVNLLCLFEAITVTMANSSTAAEDVYQYIVQQRGSPRPGSSLINFFFGMPTSCKLFERLKIIAFDHAMIHIAFHKSTRDKEETAEDVKEFIRRNRLSGWNSQIALATFNTPSKGPYPMSINYALAVWKEITQQHTESAIIGLALATIMEHRWYAYGFKYLPHILPVDISIEADNRYLLLPDLEMSRIPKKIEIFEIDTEWKDLYISWNLLFMIANYGTILIPIMLLIPSVLAAETPYFLEPRVAALFLISNLFVYQHVQTNSFFFLNFENSDKISSKWIELNKEYAERLLKIACPKISKNLTEIYKEVYGNHPTFHFLTHLFSFVLDPKNFHLTPYGKQG